MFGVQFNQGKLKGSTVAQSNIIYYRRNRSELSINLTNNCPNSCYFCIRDRDIGWGVSNLYLKKEPSLEEIKAELERTLDSNSFDKIKICGYGEPILRIDIIPEIISFIE